MGSSVGIQMPELYLRGSLCNVTMRNLTENQKEEIDGIVSEVKDDPLLQPCRVQFRNVLSYTIGIDYKDSEAADQEYQIAVWRAVVAAKYGWGKNPPAEKTLNDDIQRKKFIQTWVFNYMRQILQENKRPIKNITQREIKPSHEAAVVEITKTLGKLAKIQQQNDCSFIEVDLWLCPYKTINNIHQLIIKYINSGVDISLEDHGVKIKNHSNGYDLVEVKVPTKINMISANSNDDDDDNSIGEIADESNSYLFRDNEALNKMYGDLSITAKNVLILILDPPQDFIDKYGKKAAKRYIGEYLNLSNRELKDVYAELRMRYVMAIGTPEVED